MAKGVLCTYSSWHHNSLFLSSDSPPGPSDSSSDLLEWVPVYCSPDPETALVLFLLKSLLPSAVKSFEFEE